MLVNCSSSSCYRVCYKVEDGKGNGEGGGETGDGEELEFGRTEVQARFFKLFERYLDGDDGHCGGSGVGVREWERRFLPLLEQLAALGLNSCGRCFQLMEEFCDGYHRLKTVKLELQGMVLRFKNVVEEAQEGREDGSSRLEQFRECVGTRLGNESRNWNVEEVTESLINWKELLIKSCSRKMRSGFPQVSIEKLQSHGGADGGSSSKKKGTQFWITVTRTTEEGGQDGNEINNDLIDGQRANEDYELGFETTPPSRWKAGAGESDKNSEAFKRRLSSPQSRDFAPAGPFKRARYDNDNTEVLSADHYHHDPSSPSYPSNGPVDDQRQRGRAKPRKSDPRSIAIRKKQGPTQPTKTEMRKGKPKGSTANCRRKIESVPPLGPPVNPAKSKTDNERRRDDGKTSGRSLRAAPKHRCNRCWRGFPTKYSLKKHLQDAHGDGDSSSSSDSDEGNTGAVVSSSQDAVVTNVEDNDDGDPANLQGEDEDNESVAFSAPSASESSDSEPEHPPTDKRGLKRIRIRKKTRTEEHPFFRLKCPDCQLLFKDVKSILTHRKTSDSCKVFYDPSTTVKVEVLIPPDRNPEADESHFTTVLALIDLPQAIFTCDEEACGVTVYSSEDVEVHRKLHDDGPFSCDRCDFTCSYAPALANHDLSQHPRTPTKKDWQKFSNPKKMVACPRCDFVCSTTYKLAYPVHYLKEHLPKLTLHKALCAICKVDVISMKRTRLADHFKTHHDITEKKNPPGGGIILRCSVPPCDAYFLKPYQLKSHLGLRHNIQNPQVTLDLFLPKRTFNCADCDKTFPIEGYLRAHRLKRHVNALDVIPCLIEKCKKVFESKEDLERHMERASWYHQSLDDPARQKLPCPKCNKMFPPTRLETHLTSHEREEAELAAGGCVCERCGKLCKSQMTLRAHSRIHDEKFLKFSCDFCQKKFRAREKLKIHRRTHTNERPYVCDLCGNAYAYDRSLKWHLSCRHGIGPKVLYVPYKGKRKKKPKTSNSPLSGDGGGVLVVAQEGNGGKEEVKTETDPPNPLSTSTDDHAMPHLTLLISSTATTARELRIDGMEMFR